MEGVNMLDKKEFDLWADGYDKTVDYIKIVRV